MRVAVDAVVFTVLDDALQILLIERGKEPFAGRHALPGGFVEPDEDLAEAAARELREETGVKNIFLKQLRAYGAPDRDPRGRVLSVAFLAFIPGDRPLRAATDAAAARWFPVDELPALAFDHATIVADALRELRFELQTTNIAAQILPRRFTLSQLQHLYETVLQRPLDKRNFRKRIKELGLLAETGEYWREGAHRPAMLYAFASRRYADIAEKLHVFL